jgi:hypothetical protein
MSNRDDIRPPPEFERLDVDLESGQKRSYKVTDPALDLVKCRCGKPDCKVAMQRPLREHIAALCKAIISCGPLGILRENEDEYEPWPGVVYALQMAASLDDVFADPSIIDDSEAAYWCEGAWDSDERDRESASKYVAALITFNFVWTAYVEKQRVFEASTRYLRLAAS